MKRIPEWQYPLYKDSDRIAYSLFENIGKSGKYPEIIGTESEVNDFLKLMIVSQKSKNYRQFRDIAIEEIKSGRIDVPALLEKGKNLEYVKGVDESWAIFQQDKRICELIDAFYDAKIKFEGKNREIAEFIIRFFLSQLLQDWRGPKMAVVLECLNDKKVKVSKLNKLLKIWDYTKIFKK
jgi:hypothetical protein